MIFILLCFQFFAGYSQTDFERGNQWYQKNDYAKAIDAYKSYIQQNPYDYLAYFNLGNSYYQKENYALSLWSYEKSLKIKPNFDQAKFNAKKAYAKSHLRGQWKSSTYWLLRILFSVGYNFWAYIAILSALLLSGAAFVYFKTVRIELKRIFLLTNVVFLFILLVSTALAGFHYKRLHNEQFGIIIQSNTHAKVSPDWNEKTAFDLPAGKKVRILQKNKDWVEIELNKSHTGWVSAQSLAGI